MLSAAASSDGEHGFDRLDDPRQRAFNRARDAMIETGQWEPAQFMGRRFAVGCVALEITQRCNLDCSACYLSAHSEAVRDVPLVEIFRRIEMVREAYGPGVDVQITGGDPTLRRRDELVAIVRQLCARDMRATLFTNGIRAKRDLLAELAAAGLAGVAFHVDLTQERPGYASERDLHQVRLDYIERARGLPLAVYFNTTVFDGNFAEIPDIAAFFIRHSDVVRIASFQPQANTGRGVADGRGPAITTRSVIRQIEAGAGTRLSFDTARVGHALCNRFAMVLVIGDSLVDLLDSPILFQEALELTATRRFSRSSPGRAFLSFARAMSRRPAFLLRCLPWLVSRVWRYRAELLKARCRVHKLAFYIHNFMDGCALDPDRLKACVFTAATDRGPVPMCQHNADRDATILRPTRIAKADGEWFWNPVSGKLSRRLPEVVPPDPDTVGLRRRKASKRQQ